MADNNPNLPSGAGSVPPSPPTPPLGGTPAAAPKSESGKIQPKKETVRINLPPKPTAAPTIKIPAPSAIHAAAPAAAASAAPAAPRASAPAASAPAAAAPASRPAAAPAAPAPATRPAAAAAPRYAPAGGGYDMVDKVLAITAAVVALVALIRVVTL